MTVRTEPRFGRRIAYAPDVSGDAGASSGGRQGSGGAWVADFELGNTSPRSATTGGLLTALESAGVEFIAENGGGAGVRLRTNQKA
jgi:hypothetical protein